MKTFVKSGLLAAGGMLAALAPLPAGAASFDLLYSFAGGKDGAGPFGALIQDTAGNFYGTTSSGGHKYNGTIFKLAKPAAGGSTWTESVLYAFRGGSKDGSNPDAALAMDSSGALYGTTQDGGVGQVNGTIFRLAPRRRARPRGPKRSCTNSVMAAAPIRSAAWWSARMARSLGRPAAAAPVRKARAPCSSFRRRPPAATNGFIACSSRLPAGRMAAHRTPGSRSARTISSMVRQAPAAPRARAPCSAWHRPRG
ncbi:MAG: choice-of-anchor tandem repeat GloVer-containing protein [Rhodospirillales bacterium]